MSADLSAVLVQVAQGNKEAFCMFYEQTASRVYRIGLNILGEPSLAEDLLQDVYLRVWRRAEDYHPDRGSPQNWVASIARYRAIDLRRGCHMDGEAQPLPVEAVIGVAGDEVVQLSRCLEELDEDDRQSIYTSYYLGLSHTEVAQRLAKPLGSVKTYLRRGLSQLRECMGR